VGGVFCGLSGFWVVGCGWVGGGVAWVWVGWGGWGGVVGVGGGLVDGGAGGWFLRGLVVFVVWLVFGGGGCWVVCGAGVWGRGVFVWDFPRRFLIHVFLRYPFP